nr:hypothetical protein CFP56_16470 [Quercus suber]
MLDPIHTVSIEMTVQFIASEYVLTSCWRCFVDVVVVKEKSRSARSQQNIGIRAANSSCVGPCGSALAAQARSLNPGARAERA